MDTARRGIIQLIKSAITGEALALPEGFDIQTAAAILKKRGLVTLGYAGAVNCGIDPELPVMVSLQDQYLMEYYRSDCQLKRLQQVFGAFEENGIDYMPLKGTVMKSLYPSHEMRPMCDADILIREEQYSLIRPVMQQLGFRDAGESDHEYIWKCDELLLELHKRLIPTYHKDYYGYFGIGWQKAVLQEGHRWGMSKEDTYLYDFTHFTKHFRTSGVTCRMIIDLWLYQRSFLEMDKTFIQREMDKLGLGEFYGYIQHLISAWFCDGPWDDRTEFISNYIFDGGVTMAVADRAKAAQNAGDVTAGNKKLFWKKVFPNKNNLAWNYPQLKHLPLPIAWVARWVLLLTVRRDHIEKQVHQMQDTSQESVQAHIEGMAYVGLKFSE